MIRIARPIFLTSKVLFSGKSGSVFNPVKAFHLSLNKTKPKNIAGIKNEKTWLANAINLTAVLSGANSGEVRL